jgi:hypothetical protein
MRNRVISLFFAAVMTAAIFTSQAAIAVVTPNKKSCITMHIDEQGLMQFGAYEIFVEGKDGKWAPAGKITDGKNYVGKQLDLSKFLKPGEAAKIRIVNTDGNAAHIDSVALGGMAPSTVMVNGVNDDIAGRKLARMDMDVIPAHEKVIDLTFPANRKDATLTLSARIEALNITPYDFKFPVENIYTDIGGKSKFFTYELGANVGKLSLNGKPGETGGMVPFFKEFSLAGTGHPSAFTYGWVMNDDKYLYVAIDFTGDNTEDGNKDYTKVFAKINGKVKEFKLSKDQSKWGKPSFTYTDKVAYEHKYYEFRIPLEEVGGKENKNLELAFAAYGTCAPLTFDPTGAPYTFAAPVAVGSSSATVPVTVSGLGVMYTFTSLTFGSGLAAIVASSGGNFGISNSTCFPGVNLHNQCTFDLTFSPTVVGVLDDSIIALNNNDQSCKGTLAIRGTGVAAAVHGCTDPNATNYNPAATIDDGSCVFPRANITGGRRNVNIGDNPSTTGGGYTGSITLTNSGDLGAYIHDRTLARTDANALTQGGGLNPPFYIEKDNCSGRILQPRRTCKIDIVFFPIEDGTYAQSFNLYTDTQHLGFNVTGTSTSVAGNAKPAAFTSVGAVVNGTGATLSWNATTDPEKDPVSYFVQYCDSASFVNCAPQSAAGATSASASKGSQYGLSMAGALMVFGFMAFGGIRSRKMKLLLVAFALSYGAMGQSCGGGSSAPEPVAKQVVMSLNLSGLKADTTYYWKVAASDKRGGAVESDAKIFVTGR